MFKSARFLASAVILAGFAIPLSAQTSGDELAVPDSGLNLPSDLSTFGKVEKTLRKPMAMVNGEIITGTDVDHRLALIQLANSGQIAGEELERLRIQVFRNLLDEILQIQAAKAEKIDVPTADVDQSFTRVASNFKRTPDQLSQYLRDSGSSPRSIRRQIEAEIAWSRLLRRKVEVNVSDAEVNAILARLNEARGTPEFHLGEIYMSASAETAPQVVANLQKILEQLKQGRSFQAYARQFSEASTAVTGGDLGWVRTVQVPQSLGDTATGMAVGQVAGPVEVPGGFSLLYLIDKRQVLMADPRDAVLSLKQLSLNFPASQNDVQAQAVSSEFGKATQAMGGCGKADEVAAKFGATVVENDQVQIRGLPGPLQELMLQLQVGDATPPFGSKAEGVRVLVVCGRDEAQTGTEPNAEQIRSDKENERVNQRAQRYLRDLRRDAVIEYR
jgi:peptidyl-prolyl cis-trans isomerase SurA